MQTKFHLSRSRSVGHRLMLRPTLIKSLRPVSGKLNQRVVTTFIPASIGTSEHLIPSLSADAPHHEQAQQTTQLSHRLHSSQASSHLLDAQWHLRMSSTVFRNISYVEGRIVTIIECYYDHLRNSPSMQQSIRLGLRRCCRPSHCFPPVVRFLTRCLSSWSRLT